MTSKKKSDIATICDVTKTRSKENIIGNNLDLAVNLEDVKISHKKVIKWKNESSQLFFCLHI